MTYTTEQKYQFLLSKLFVTDEDYWEQDAMIRMLSIYFQFGAECPSSVDEAIELAMRQG